MSTSMLVFNDSCQYEILAFWEAIGSLHRMIFTNHAYGFFNCS